SAARGGDSAGGGGRATRALRTAKSADVDHVALRNAARGREAVIRQVTGNHVGDDGEAGPHLSGFFRLVEGPGIAAEIDDPQQEQQEHRQDQRELCRAGTARVALEGKQRAHNPITGLCAEALRLMSFTSNPRTPASDVIGESGYPTDALTVTRGAWLPLVA